MRLFWPKEGSFDEGLSSLQKQTPLYPFQVTVLEFVQALSKRLVRVKGVPEIVALGYWLRKAHIHEMHESWIIETVGKVIRPRGTIFHIAPSNVDTIFVYSWMLSLLAGNRNVIRISSKETELNELLHIIVGILEQVQFQEIANRTIICTYGYEEKATELLSAVCHTRVIWGGDDTVSKIRQIPLAPMANELAFPDRFSQAVVHASIFNKLNDVERKQLLEQFYNDVFWFDQMACSSPRLVTWVGEEKVVSNAQQLFWQSFEQVIQSKQYELLAATQVLKLTTSLWMATEQDVQEVKSTPYFSRIAFNDLYSKVRERHCGGGLFFERTVSNLIVASEAIIDKDQTLTYFGFTRDEIITFVDSISTRGIDRIVPIGQALNFDSTWDGQNFLKSFTREVVII